MYVSRLPMPNWRVTVKPLASSACAYSSAMILDSVKSAEPTLIDFRSPEISPPPSGFELPQAAVTRAKTAASRARYHLLVFGIALDIPNVLSPQAPSGPYRHAGPIAALCNHRENDGLFRKSSERAKMDP